MGVELSIVPYPVLALYFLFPSAHVRAQLTRDNEDTSSLISALSMQSSVGVANSVAFNLFEFEFALKAHNLVKKIWGSS